MAPDTAAELVVGGAREVPDDDVVALARTVYGAHPDVGDPAWYPWLYESGPWGSAVRGLATIGGRPVAHYAVVPVMLQMAGTQVTACLGVNALTHREAQGRGLFAKLVQRVNNAAAAQGLAITYVVAGPESAPWFGSILRYQSRGALSLFLRPVSTARLAGALSGRLSFARPLAYLADPFVRLALVPARVGPPAGTELREVTQWDAAFDEFWRVNGASFHHTTVRSSAFLHWRFAAATTRRYRAIAAYRRGELAGYVVFRVRTTHHASSPPFGSIVDLIAAPTREGQTIAAALVSAAIDALRRERIAAIVAQLAVPSPFERALERNGLLRMPGKNLGHRPILFRGDEPGAAGTLHHTGADYDMG